MSIIIHTPNIHDILQPGGLIAWILVGLIAGAIAGSLVRGRGYGCIGDIIVGLIGSLIGAFIASAFNLGGFHFCGSIFISVIGAVIFLSLLRLLTGTGRDY